MTGKEYFNGIRAKIDAISILRRRMEEIAELSTALGGFNYDEPRVMGGMPKNKYEDKAIMLAELSKQLSDALVECVKAKSECDLRLMQMPNRTYVKVLRLRYLEDKRHSWGWIADEMNYSEDRIKHLLGEALTDFEARFLKG